MKPLHLFCVFVGTCLCHLMFYIKANITMPFTFYKTIIASISFISARTDHTIDTEVSGAIFHAHSQPRKGSHYRVQGLRQY